MQRKRLMLVSALAAGMFLVVGSSVLTTDAAVAGGKTLTLKLLLPQSDTKVTVDGKEIPGSGEERKITVMTAKDKDYVLITAFWEPNNYTKITRPRKVVAKDGEIVVSFLKPSDKEKDDIVVRWVPTPPDVVDAMCKMGKVTKDDVVYDLGCGDGIMVFTAVKKFGAKKGVGVDLDPDLVKKCQAKAKEEKLEDRVEFRVGDVLKVEDLPDATVVLLYMGDDINKRLKPILQTKLKPGARVVSHRFLMGDDWRPEKTETIHSTSNGQDCLIHLWTIQPK
jgi:SAM-dependent methyltransferase